MEFQEETSEIKKIFKLHGEINRRYLGKSFYQLKELGIHPGQMPILQILKDQDGCSQREIAAKLEIKPPTVNVSIQRLEKSGVVYRKKDEKDQRITRVYLTDKGKEIVSQCMKRMEENEQILLKGFSDVEMCLIRRFFEQILKNMDDMPGEAETGFDFFKKGGVDDE